MDRSWLKEQLAAGRSIESIAREVNRDPSTVSYWVHKHGLQSSHAAQHAARGGIERDALEDLVAEGLALQFHHVDPSTKAFTLRDGDTRSLARMREEASKCVLLCANCHAEVEAGRARLPLAADGARPG